jgi:hypothetical protein
MLVYVLLCDVWEILLRAMWSILSQLIITHHHRSSFPSCLDGDVLHTIYFVDHGALYHHFFGSLVGVLHRERIWYVI